MEFLPKKIVKEWSWRLESGIPDWTNPLHLVELKNLLIERRFPHDFINLFINELEFKDKAAFDAYNKKHKMRKSTKVTIGDAETTVGDVEDEPTAATPAYDQPEWKDDEEKTDTSKAISKVNDKRFGVLKKKETALEKGYIGPEDAQKLDEFNQDINEFLKNPTKEVAEALVEQYKLSQNAAGSKLYLGFIAGDGRKILGENNKLVQEVGGVINKFVDLKSKGKWDEWVVNQETQRWETVLKELVDLEKHNSENKPYDESIANALANGEVEITVKKNT